MAEKQLAKSFWNEIVTTVVYIQNKCLSIKSKTPFKKYNNQLPNVSNLRILSCQALVCVSDITSSSTIDLRSWQGIMVGYEINNQWKIYNPITKKVHISGDVKFDKGYTYDSKLNDH